MSQAKTESVLLIECQPADARLITNALQDDAHQGLQVRSIKKLSDGLERIHKGGVRGIILDIQMSNGRGVATFEKLRSSAPHVPILILSGVENENVAKQAVDRGAQDYLLKSNLDHFRLRRAVHFDDRTARHRGKNFFTTTLCGSNPGVHRRRGDHQR
jgi:two-component system cell cycle response regulator